MALAEDTLDNGDEDLEELLVVEGDEGPGDWLKDLEALERGQWGSSGS